MPFVSETVFHSYKTVMVLGISARKFGRCVKRSKEKHSSLLQSAMPLPSSSSHLHLPSINSIYPDTTVLFCCLLFLSLHSPTVTVICCYLPAVLVKALCWTTPSWHGGPSAQCSTSLLLWNGKTLKLGWSTHQECQQYGGPEVEDVLVRLCYVLAPRHIKHKWCSVTYQHWWSCMSWFSLPERHQHRLI